jgi:hypothetical protein
VTVLFGSCGSGGNETWEWNGTKWKKQATTGPSSRASPAMAYDSERGVTVLFGGSDGSHVYGDTWEWNGITWTLRTSTGPSPRGGLAMAYDSARGVTVLFGGGDTTHAYGDTWEWNGSAWALRTSTGPSPRGGHAMVYDSARGVTVLFGGTSGGDETWEWDGVTWTKDIAPGPPPRSYHAMAYDSQRRVTVLFGGIAPNGYYPLGDRWEFDGDRRAWSTNYGSGWPGTIGVPSFTTTSEPRLCSTITLNLGNSRGATTIAALLLGLAPTDQPTDYDGHILVVPRNIQLLRLPPAGLALPGGLPCDSFFCGLEIDLQALEADPGASKSISFTRGLRLTLGQ